MDRLAFILALVLTAEILVTANGASACLWDYDTLAMERARFPDALELITGKFPRHSEAFYNWRINDRLKRLEQEPNNVALYDDLAVAYDKVGDHAKAIETMLRKEEIAPGLYETAANLGTFYIHDGQLEKGVGYLRNALTINPNAHFGREQFQVLLVEYVLQRSSGDNVRLPLREEWPPRHQYSGAGGSKGFLDQIPSAQVSPDAAVIGVLGMMRFGNYDSPILLEALGDLLYEGAVSGRLAARAYLMASYQVEEKEVKRKYRELASVAIEFQTSSPWRDRRLTLEDIESRFRAELAEAEVWYSEVRRDEINWIESGENPEEKFVEKYYTSPSIEGESVFRIGKSLVAVVVTLALCMIVLAVGFRHRRYK